MLFICLSSETGSLNLKECQWHKAKVAAGHVGMERNCLAGAYRAINSKGTAWNICSSALQTLQSKLVVFQNFKCPQNPGISKMLFVMQWPFVMIILSPTFWISCGSCDRKGHTQGLPFPTMAMMASVSQAEKNGQKQISSSCYLYLKYFDSLENEVPKSSKWGLLTETKTRGTVILFKL